MLVSYTIVCPGKLGLHLKTPLINRDTKGSLPKDTPFFLGRMADKADLAPAIIFYHLLYYPIHTVKGGKA